MATTEATEFNRAMGIAIRQQRQARGFNQTMLGNTLGVTYQQIAKGESGINAFSAHQLCLLAAFFGMSVGELYDLAGIASEAPEQTPADNDAILAARHVARIKDDTLRRTLVDFTRKLAYEGARA